MELCVGSWTPCRLLVGAGLPAHHCSKRPGAPTSGRTYRGALAAGTAVALPRSGKQGALKVLSSPAALGALLSEGFGQWPGAGYFLSCPLAGSPPRGAGWGGSLCRPPCPDAPGRFPAFRGTWYEGVGAHTHGRARRCASAHTGMREGVRDHTRACGRVREITPRGV